MARTPTMKPKAKFLSPSGLAEWEARPAVAYLRYAVGRGDLVPRPHFDGFDVGAAVDRRVKACAGRPLARVWPGARLAERRPALRADAEHAAVADRITQGLLACPLTRGLRWDPTADRVAYRTLDLAGVRVPVGGIPDAFAGATVPVDLKVTTAADGALRSFTAGWCSVDGALAPRVARGADGAGDWVIRRHPEWATAAVFYAWVVRGWTETVTAAWVQADGSRPDRVTVRVLRARLGPRFVRTVARRAAACWRALRAGDAALDAPYRGMEPEWLAVLCAP